MSKINTHGLKMTGLKAASGSTQNYGVFSPSYDELFYNRSTGEVWTVFQHSIGHNSWTVYHDANVLKICDASSHMTMQEIADAIAETVAQDDAQAEFLADIGRQYAQAEIRADIDRRYAQAKQALFA